MDGKVQNRPESGSEPDLEAYFLFALSYFSLSLFSLFGCLLIVMTCLCSYQCSYQGSFKSYEKDASESLGSIRCHGSLQALLGECIR